MIHISPAYSRRRKNLMVTEITRTLLLIVNRSEGKISMKTMYGTKMIFMKIL
jgi:hypothetical protein